MYLTKSRALHSLEVASLMYDKAKEIYEKELKKTGADTFDWKKFEHYEDDMFLLGWLHDIGYQLCDKQEEHAHQGGLFLKEKGFPYWEEVYNHGDPSIENPSLELQFLNYADMHVNSKGEYMFSCEERLRDIEVRYGKDSTQYTNAFAIILQLSMSEYFFDD